MTAFLRAWSGQSLNCAHSKPFVEAVIAGPPAAVDAMSGALRQEPPSAHVSHVEVEAWAGEIPTGFDARPTV